MNPLRRIGATFATFLGSQVVFLLIFVVPLGVFGDWRLTIPAFIGGLVSIMNSVGLVFAWPRILEKKDVALAFGVIVSKFAISIGIVYWLTLPTTKEWLQVQSVERFFSPTSGGDSTGRLAETVLINLIGNPIAIFAFGMAVVLPATVIAAWVESASASDDHADAGPSDARPSEDGRGTDETERDLNS